MCLLVCLVKALLPFSALFFLHCIKWLFCGILFVPLLFVIGGVKGKILNTFCFLFKTCCLKFLVCIFNEWCAFEKGLKLNVKIMTANQSAFCWQYTFFIPLEFSVVSSFWIFLIYSIYLQKMLKVKLDMILYAFTFILENLGVDNDWCSPKMVFFFYAMFCFWVFKLKDDNDSQSISLFWTFFCLFTGGIWFSLFLNIIFAEILNKWKYLFSSCCWLV